ncbi:uncharacterized protein DUF1329 [Panacagrimonas perspica]|uniref:Uncharacterized protein DUF1329 n=1 Tax=Panacagrimonas perspica TaxID=381431 RepID=A0A4S3K0Y2_9GAMM|nr:DUF1329 domain-containing protein [Panacagrimonas perspica]TDU23222.1 uncharacterized protein DUF1329 [Panacagrimonas perspica]THD01374.1 hypothetical protein B1810_19705 [Panacagrimonas perspica]
MNRLLLNSSFVLSLLLPLAAAAKVGADKAAMLDSATHTCVGAERAGTASGVAAYTGKYLDSWPGMKDKSGYDPGPYADEKPLFTITADNMATYADRLTEGQKALLKKHPKTFRMAVYPSHRDFRMPDWVCKVVKQNATTAELVDNGLGTTGTDGGIPFPFPQSGLEAIWNMISPYRAYSEAAVNDIIDVYGNGKLAYGKQRYRSLNVTTNPNRRGSYTDKIAAHFFVESLLPARDRGSIAVGIQPNNFSKDSTMAWQYNPGIRRVRQAPEICCDFPVPPAGLRTIDDDYVFNGSPERYTWKLVGKKEMVVPWHNFRVNDPAIKYAQLATPGSINADYVRYELQRVWVIEAELKSGMRHIYKRRTIYAQEDTWFGVWGDNYDNRDQLWRAALINYRYAPDAQTYQRGVSVYHDLTADAYEATYLVNEAGEGWWRMNDPKIDESMFGPKAATLGGK